MSKKRKEYLRRVIHFIVSIIPSKKTIIFESYPDLGDNTKPVFDELVKRGYNKKYKLVWFCYDNEKICLEGVNIVYPGKQKILAQFYSFKAIAKIFCNRFLPSYSKQFSINLTHGAPIKDTSKYYNSPKNVCYTLSPCVEMVGPISKCLNYPREKIVSLGYPRNDLFYDFVPIDLKQLFGKHKKYIAWYPTFRQKKISKKSYTDCKNSIPIIYDFETAKALNEYASERDILIIIKPHFIQDLSFFQNLELSNIVIINDSFFHNSKILSYQLIGSCDALLSDYSSVIFDFMLCNKPIGLVWEDIENYRKNPGIIPEVEKFLICGDIIYNFEELCSFLNNVALGIDNKNELRNRVCDKMGMFRDGHSTKRVTDFIVDKAGL